MIIEHDTCIIGAGWSGLLACKYFKAEGFNPIILEKRDHIGGVWCYDPEQEVGGVLSSTITTSSKTATEMSDHPMPEDFPDFPHHTQIMAYLHSYCERFGLYRHIRLGAGVESAWKEGEDWIVQSADGTMYRCQRLVVCSGVHQEPERSGRETLAGFSGEVIHSVRIKKRLPDMAGKRVLLVGTGETASDLAVELARLTPHLAVSSPRGQWFAGRTSNFPADPPTLNDYYSSPMRRLLDPLDSAFATVQLLEDRYGACGSGVTAWQTSRPYQGQFLNKNTLLIDLWRLGQVTAKPAITACEEQTVRFSDGSVGEYDVAILCTGFETVFPFLPAPYDTRRVDAHFKLMLADDESLSFVGFARPVVGSIPTIAELQSRCLAAMYAGRIPVPGDRPQTIARDQAYTRRRFCSTRIAGLVDMSRYLDGLASWLDVHPDYGRLFRESPRQWWSAVVAPYNGALYWLHDDTRRADALKQLKRPRYIIQHSLHAWALILYRNAFPLRRLNVFTDRPRAFRLRQLIGLLLAPLFLPAGLTITRRSPLLQAYGVLLLLLLSPILLTRLLAQRRALARARAEYLPGNDQLGVKRPTSVQLKMSSAGVTSRSPSSTENVSIASPGWR